MNFSRDKDGYFLLYKKPPEGSVGVYVKIATISKKYRCFGGYFLSSRV